MTKHQCIDLPPDSVPLPRQLPARQLCPISGLFLSDVLPLIDPACGLVYSISFVANCSKKVKLLELKNGASHGAIGGVYFLRCQ